MTAWSPAATVSCSALRLTGERPVETSVSRVSGTRATSGRRRAPTRWRRLTMGMWPSRVAWKVFRSGVAEPRTSSAPAWRARNQATSLAW